MNMNDAISLSAFKDKYSKERFGVPWNVYRQRLDLRTIEAAMDALAIAYHNCGLSQPPTSEVENRHAVRLDGTTEILGVLKDFGYRGPEILVGGPDRIGNTIRFTLGGQWHIEPQETAIKDNKTVVSSKEFIMDPARYLYRISNGTSKK